MGETPLRLHDIRKQVDALKREGVIITPELPPKPSPTEMEYCERVKADVLEGALSRAFKKVGEGIRYGWELESRPGDDPAKRGPVEGPFLSMNKYEGPPKWKRKTKRGLTQPPAEIGDKSADDLQIRISGDKHSACVDAGGCEDTGGTPSQPPTDLPVGLGGYKEPAES